MNKLIKKVVIFLAGIFLLVFFANLLTPIIRHQFNIDNLNDPQPKSYRSDEISFLRTFYLMEKGVNYYNAFKISREEFIGGDIVRADVFTWRMPTVFYLWSLLANDGQQILTL